MNFCHQFEIWSPNSMFPILGGGRKYLFGKSFPLTAWPVMDSRSFWRLEDMGCTFLVIPNSEQKCNLFRVPCLFSVPFVFWYFVPETIWIILASQKTSWLMGYIIVCGVAPGDRGSVLTMFATSLYAPQVDCPTQPPPTTIPAWLNVAAATWRQIALDTTQELGANATWGQKPQNCFLCQLFVLRTCWYLTLRWSFF